MSVATEKELNPVFQILNFLSDPSQSAQYNLSNDEKLMLIFLAKHHGERGICMSLSKTIAKELQRDYRNIKRTLQRLKELQLVQINTNPGRPNDYFITILKLSTDLSTRGVNALSKAKEGGAQTPQGVGRRRPRGWGVHAPQSNQNKSSEIINTRCGREKAAPLAGGWFPPQKLQKLADQVGEKTYKSGSYLIDRFRKVMRGRMSKDWNGVFERFLTRELPRKNFKQNEHKITEIGCVMRDAPGNVAHIAHYMRNT